jgi:biopolymer transport protein ExbB
MKFAKRITFFLLASHWASVAALTWAAEAGADAAQHKNLFSKLAEGGPMMVPIIGCSFLVTVFAMERFVSLRRGRVIPRPFVKRFLHQIGEGKLDKEEAIQLCEESHSPAATVFAAVVRKWGRPSVELEQAVIDAVDRITPTLKKYLRLFNVIANVSPLLGLLGTVFGMINLFAMVAQSEAIGRSELLAGGISEALLTTAGGLCVAIPAVCVYVFFASKVESLVSELDATAHEVARTISAEALQEARQTKSRSRNAA